MAWCLLRWLCLSSLLQLLIIGCVIAEKQRHRIKINTQQPPSLFNSDVRGAAAAAAAASPPRSALSQPVAALRLKRPPAPVSPPPLLPSSPPASPSSALASLAGRCYHHVTAAAHPHHHYLFTLCPYANVTQTLLVWGVKDNSAVVGVWEGWDAEASELVQSFTDGDDCSARGSLRSRQTQLRIRCSHEAEDAVISAVVELRRCEYIAWLYSAAACELLPPFPIPPVFSPSPPLFSSADSQQQQEEDVEASKRRRTASLHRCIQLLHATAVAGEEAEMRRQEETGWDAAGAEQAERTSTPAASGTEIAVAACAERWRAVRKARLQAEPATEESTTPALDSELQQLESEK